MSTGSRSEGSKSESSMSLEAVGVRFEIPTERILSFKEYVLRRVTARIEHRELWALRGLDLQVKKGEVFGIVGRNGAGKSTLLKLVSQVMSPTEGRVVVRGNVAPMLELGSGFHPDLTGRENVWLNATILGIPRSTIAKEMGRVMEFAGLESFAHAPIRTYSSGMQARLGFAVATLVRPDILALDEILTVGDLRFQEKCLARISEFVAQGTTVILVSHALDTVMAHCHRVAWIDQGKVELVGTPSEVLPEYKAAFSAT